MVVTTFGEIKVGGGGGAAMARLKLIKMSAQMIIAKFFMESPRYFSNGGDFKKFQLFLE